MNHSALHGEEPGSIEETTAFRLHTVDLIPDCFAAGMKLEELDLEPFNVIIASIRKDEERINYPKDSVKL